MSTPLPHGRIAATLSDIVDAGFELLPTFGLAAIPVLDGAERPGEWPEVKRRLRSEGIRARQHRGALLLEPGELERFSSVGLFEGASELFLCSEWNDEFEPFPGRISSDLSDFEETTPLGLEEWISHSGCLLALGDGDGINYMTPSPEIAERLRSQFRAARR
jgi:hypothetical protein